MNELSGEQVQANEEDELLMPVNSPEEILESVNSPEAKEFIMRKYSNVSGSGSKNDEPKSGQQPQHDIVDTLTVSSAGQQNDDELLTPVCSTNDVILNAIEEGHIGDTQKLDFIRSSTSEFEKAHKKNFGQSDDDRSQKSQ